MEDKIIDKLIERLKLPLPGIKTQYLMAPEYRPVEETIAPPLNATKAGVLILLYPIKNKGIHFVLMKRPSYNGHHSDQISFPGGKFEIEDKNIVNTALRESYEEIGVSPKQINILGNLTDLYIPISNFIVSPIIGYIPLRPEFTLDKTEVDFIIESPLDSLLQTEVSYFPRSFDNKLYQVPCYKIKNQKVWGATSMILRELLEILK